MIDREKVIEHITDCVNIADRQTNHNWVFVRTEILHDALALLKAKEPVEERLNLCESCTKEYAECEADESDLVYGSGIGNDNIIGCPWYTNRWAVKWE